MADEQPIYFDNSILSCFQTCKEHARLRYVEDWTPKKERLALAGGRAWHAAMYAYRAARDCEIKPYGDGPPLDQAKRAFIADLQTQNSMMTVSMGDETGERRTVERYLNLLEAYTARYDNEAYVCVRRPDNGEPYLELGFALYLGFDWKGRPVMYVGKIDGILRSRTDARFYVFEHKTTTLGLGSYLSHTRPNHQITGYILAARQLLNLDVAGVVWDCAYISDRRPDPRKGTWMALGIDPEKDFGRAVTDRSETDFKEFLFDVRDAAIDYLTQLDSGNPRWRRNAPFRCHTMGGCEFAQVCATNLNPNLLKSEYVKEKWVPYEALNISNEPGK